MVDSLRHTMGTLNDRRPRTQDRGRRGYTNTFGIEKQRDESDGYIILDLIQRKDQYFTFLNPFFRVYIYSFNFSGHLSYGSLLLKCSYVCVCGVCVCCVWEK